MPRRSIFTQTERDNLLAIPTSPEDCALLFTFSESDISLICQHRGDTNRLGFAIQLSIMRYPEIATGGNEILPQELIEYAASQLNVSD